MPTIRVDTDRIEELATELEGIKRMLSGINDSYTLAQKRLKSYCSYKLELYSGLPDNIIMSEISTLNNYERFLHMAVSTYSGVNVAEKMRNDNIFSNAYNVLEYIINEKVVDYLEAIDKSDDVTDIIVNWYKWANKELVGELGDFVGLYENLIEEYTFKKPDLLGKVPGFLSNIEFVMDIGTEIKDIIKTGNWGENFADIGKILYKNVVKNGNAYINKKTNIKYLGFDKACQTMLVNTIINMGENYIDNLINYIENGEGSAGSIVTSVIIDAPVQAVTSFASPVYKLTTAVTYPIVDEVCEVFGYDLSSEYEKATGKTGLEAVFSAQKKLWVDTVYEGAKEKAANVLDSAYDTGKKLWKNWKSGMKLIFGG